MSFHVRVKVCGLTRIEDVQAVQRAGADYLGVVVDVASSPRSCSVAKARELFNASTTGNVVVTVNEGIDRLCEIASELNPHALQLHGQEPPDLLRELRNRLSCRLWKALPIPASSLTSPKEKGNEDEGEGFDLAEIVKTLVQNAMLYLDAGADAILLDTAPVSFCEPLGGTGIPGNWQIARQIVEQLPVPCLLAGGLTPENVVAAVKTVKPWGVDVASGVEAEKGVKGHALVRNFIDRAKSVLLG